MPRRPRRCPPVAADGLTQTVRLVDVFLLGPLMIGVALKADAHPIAVRAFLAFSGAATIVFNGINFIRAASPLPQTHAVG